MSEHEDEDLRRLAALPVRGLPAEDEARLRRRPRASFAREAASRSPLAVALGRFYFRVEPAGVGVIALAYLGWAVQTAFGLLR